MSESLKMTETKEEKDTVMKEVISVPEVKEIKMEPETLSIPPERLVKSSGFIEKDGIHMPFFRHPTLDRKHIETKHDFPCPPGMGEGVATHHLINEWVFN